jgi:hypothetical protein
MDARHKAGHDDGENNGARIHGTFPMSLIGRIFVILFAFCAACLVGGAIVTFAILFPELSAMDTGIVDPNAINILVGFGFIFFSGFALIPALIVITITEAFSIRSVLAYALGGALVGVACYLGLIPYDTTTMTFDGIVRRHLEVLAGAGIIAGLIYWVIAGRNAGAWRQRRPLPPQPDAAAKL